MDSLTQIVLGAAVGEAVLGRKVGNRAILWGAVAGTIPDLDIVCNYFVDDVRANELHRGFSHSLIFVLLVSPVFGWLVKNRERLFLASFLAVVFLVLFFALQSLNAKIILSAIFGVFWFLTYKMNPVPVSSTRKDWTKLMFWTLVTHPLLDCHTSWGTQFLWPLPVKISWNNIFVADPMYTFPFLFCVLIVMFLHRSSKTRRWVNNFGIIISSAYMLVTLVFKGVTYYKFDQALERQNIQYESMSTRPTPFNTILWTANVNSGENYYLAYYSLLDKTDNISFVPVPKNHAFVEDWKEDEILNRLINLSQNEWSISEIEGQLYFNDLRFGQMGEPSENGEFVFQYKLFPDGNKLRAEGIPPPEPQGEELSRMLSELWTRVKGI